ncbi:NUDIX domain-containing protein [Candidatus Parcubacteria bacterium]|nr:NUDIX domain-containing protein [Candidatus Parcubacteria bacterium]
MAARNVSVLGLYNDQGEILLQHRSKDAIRLPDYWAFFGGGIEKDETPEQALARELHEELEYSVKAPVLIFSQKFIYKEDENTKYVYIERFNPDKPLVQHEGQEMKWWKFEDMDHLLIVDHDRIALAKIKEFLQKL